MRIYLALMTLEIEILVALGIKEGDKVLLKVEPGGKVLLEKALISHIYGGPTNMNETFDAVYYSQPVPFSFYTLTVLALVFDKIYFPGVYIPHSGVDEIETIKEINRVKSLGRIDIETAQLINCMVFSLYNKYLKDFCVFTGEFGYMGVLEEGAEELTMLLEELIFGPPPPNFHPTPSMGFAKDLPGDKEASVNGPSWISYPANALIYATKHGLPLINDNPNLPVPALGGVSPKNNAKILSTILALESVKLALPQLKELKPQEIMEFRYDTREYVKPFRLAMLRLSKELNAAINSEMEISEIEKEARFLVETTVYPELEELEKFITDPAKPWYKRVIDLAKTAPELVSNFFTMPKHLAIAKLLEKCVLTLTGLVEDELDKQSSSKARGFYYLLRIKQDLSR